MSKVFGIGGKLAAGKDVVADYLVENHGFVKLGMSDALHEAALKLNPIVSTWLDIDDYSGAYVVMQTTYQQATEDFGYVDAKETYPEYRRFLQVLGTEVGREMFGVNVWIDIMMTKIMKLSDEGKDVVVTGIRFPNEVEMINKLWLMEDDAKSIWVKRPPQNAAQAVVAHASENSVTEDDFDVVLYNNGTKEELYEQVEELIEEG